MDPDGVVVRFINSSAEGNGLSSAREINEFFRKVKPRGGTPLGEELVNKIINKIVKPLAKHEEFERPVLVICITDGEPTNKSAVINAILECKNFCANTKYGEKAVAFSFSQVGSDSCATTYLSKLDTDPQVGHIIDCTSEYSIEKQECGEGFTEAVWVVKTMIGTIDPAYDQSDEQNNVPQLSSYDTYNGSSNFQAPPSYNTYNGPPNFQAPPSYNTYSGSYNTNNEPYNTNNGSSNFQAPPSYNTYNWSNPSKSNPSKSKTRNASDPSLD